MLQSAVTTTHVMLRLVFIVECGIARFLCAVHVFKVRVSSSPPGLPLCQILFAAASIAELAHGEKSCTQSITHPAYLMPREPNLLLRKNVRKQYSKTWQYLTQSIFWVDNAI